MTRINSYLKENFINFLLLVGTVLFTLLLIEVGHSIYKLIRSSKSYFRIDQTTEERYLIPRIVRKKKFIKNGTKITIRINSLGWRDREISLEKKRRYVSDCRSRRLNYFWMGCRTTRNLCQTTRNHSQEAKLI